MASISLTDAGKKFSTQWVFRNLNLEIKPRERLAITGFNGSGKSTLLQAISGFQSLSEGTILYTVKNATINSEHWHRHISYAAPYLDVPEEYTFEELIRFQSKFKPLTENITTGDMLQISGLTGIENKAIKNYSSGMKQRIKLSLAVMSAVPVLLLDEPLSNLDQKGVSWYKSLIEEHAKEKTIIVCSNNIQEEIFFCDRKIDIHDYKQAL